LRKPETACLPFLSGDKPVGREVGNLEKIKTPPNLPLKQGEELALLTLEC